MYLQDDSLSFTYKASEWMREKHRILPVESSDTCRRRPRDIHGLNLCISYGGKAVVQIAAIEIAIDPLLDINAIRICHCFSPKKPKF